MAQEFFNPQTSPAETADPMIFRDHGYIPTASQKAMFYMSLRTGLPWAQASAPALAPCSLLHFTGLGAGLEGKSECFHKIPHDPLHTLKDPTSSFQFFVQAFRKFLESF